MNAVQPSQPGKHEIIVAAICAALPGIYLLLTSTTTLVSGEFVYDVKRLLEVILLAIVFVLALLTPALRQAVSVQFGRMPRWLAIALGLIVALGVVSAVVNARSTMHAAYSLLEVALLTLLVLAAVVMSACRTVAGRTFDLIGVTLFALVAIAVGVQELLGVAAALANDLEFYFRISLMHFSWPRFYNQVQSWTVPVLATLPLIWSQSHSQLLRSRTFQTIVCLTALGLNWYVMLMTGGRGVAVSLASAFVIGLLLLRASRKIFLVWHLAGIVTGAILYFAILQASQPGLQDSGGTESPQPTQSTPQSGSANPRDFYEKPEDTSRFAQQSLAGRVSLDSSGRWDMWRGSLHDIRTHPFLGVGPMNYACTGPDYRSGHPHNFALQFAGEWGIPATLLLLVVLGFLGTSALSNLRLVSPTDPRKEVSSFLAIGLIAAGLYSCLSGVMVMPASQIAGVFISGWCLASLTREPATPGDQPRIAAILVAVAVVLSLSVSTLSWHEFAKRPEYEKIVPIIDHGIPRYWQHGKTCKYL